MPTGEALAGVVAVPLGTGRGEGTGGSVPHDATVGLSWNVAGHEAGEGMGSGGSVS